MKKCLTIFIVLVLISTAIVGYCDGEDVIPFKCTITSGALPYTIEDIMADVDFRAAITISLCLDLIADGKSDYTADQIVEYLTNDSYVACKNNIIFVAGHIGEEILLLIYYTANQTAAYGSRKVKRYLNDQIDSIIMNVLKKLDKYYRNDPDTMEQFMKVFSETH